MTEKHRAPREYIVHISFTVGIEHIGAIGSLKKYRRTAHSAKGSDWGVNATRYAFLSGFKEVVRARVFLSHENS
jgi:hypothetical protein